MGEECAKILSEMSDDIKLEQELKRIFKPSDLSEVTNRWELAMKRLSNGTTTSGEVRDLALKIQERTGVDLIKESRLAQLSMDIAWDIRGANLFGLVQDVKNDGIVKWALKSAGKIFADKESVARANTIRNIFWVPKDAKIEWLNRAILETKFSKNDTKAITEIAKKLQSNQPLTEVQTKNLVTIQKLMEEKMTTKQVENFRKNLPNAEIGRWLTSKNTQEPAVAMANTGKKFDENFRKISEKRMKKMKTAISKNKAYFLKYKPKQELIDFVKKNLI